MVGPIYQFPEQNTPSHVSADRTYTSAMTGMYGWTTLAACPRKNVLCDNRHNRVLLLAFHNNPRMV